MAGLGVGDHDDAPCYDCDGSGWTEDAALATECWTEVLEGLWVGGHDYNNGTPGDRFAWGHEEPKDTFDTVVSMYTCEYGVPSPGVNHYVSYFYDAQMTEEMIGKAWDAAVYAHTAWTMGRKVLIRCQAGLNRANLVTTLVLLIEGWEPGPAIAMLREKRSPWVLCNQHFEDYLMSLTTAEEYAE
jgi:hypothetical protein